MTQGVMMMMRHDDDSGDSDDDGHGAVVEEGRSNTTLLLLLDRTCIGLRDVRHHWTTGLALYMTIAPTIAVDAD